MDVQNFSVGPDDDNDDPRDHLMVPDDAGTFAGMTVNEVIATLCHVSAGDWWWSHKHAEAFSIGGLNTALSSLHKKLAIGAHAPTTFIGWLKKNTTVKNYTRFVKRAGQGLICGQAVNKWRPLPEVPEHILKQVKREGPAVVKVWLDIAHDLCNGKAELAGKLLDWAAFIVMEPAQKPGWSVILYSSIQGIGKDMFVHGLSRALGGVSNATTIGRKDLEGTFNTHLEKRLIHVSDLHTTTRGSMNGSDTYDLLKQVTSNFPETILVNEKREPKYDAENLAGWVISSNDESPIAIPQEDRRWYVLEGREDRRADEFYAKANAWLRAPETGDLIRGFLQLRWESMGKERRAAIAGIAPETEAKVQMVAASLPPVAAVVKEWITSDDCRDLVQLDDVLTYLVNLKQSDRLSRNAPIPNKLQLSIMMKKFGAVQVPVGKDGKSMPARLPNQDLMRLYAVRRIETYASMSPLEVGKRYASQQPRVRTKY